VSLPETLTFHCPPEMTYWCQKVFDGEYGIGWQPAAGTSPKIIDIGANAGAFALWAQAYWPGAEVFCYEPAAVNFHYLKLNCSDKPRLHLHNVAVLTSDRKKLYCGKQNQGQASFFPELEETTDTYEMPIIMRPEALPEADILKCDAEGAEAEIIPALLAAGRKFQAVMFEYHSDEIRRQLDALLSKDYLLVGAEAKTAHRGVLKYVAR